MKKCSVEECENTNIIARGLCMKHYQRVRRHGSVEIPKKCNADGCQKHYNGNPEYPYCRTHLKNMKRYGDPNIFFKSKKANETCSVDGCEKPYRSTGLCDSHYHDYLRLKKERGIEEVEKYINLQREKKPQSSRYRGVFWVKAERKFRAQVIHKKKLYHIGTFNSEIEAARAYNKKAKELKGDKAKLNVIKEETMS